MWENRTEVDFMTNSTILNTKHLLTEIHCTTQITHTKSLIKLLLPIPLNQDYKIFDTLHIGDTMLACIQQSSSNISIQWWQWL